MVKAIITDFSRVLLFPKDRSYSGSLNGLHRELSQKTDYNILEHFELNMDLLRYYESLKNKVKLYIFTSETIQDDPAFQSFIQPVFEGVYSAVKLNIKKKESDAYKVLAIELKINPNEILYIDDTEANNLAANEAGLKVILYKNNEQTIQEIDSQLNETQ